LIAVDFGDLPDKLVRLTHLVASKCDRFAMLDHDSIAWNFVCIANELVKVGYTEKSGDSVIRAIGREPASLIVSLLLPLGRKR
jgi:hypothetical protein